MRKIIVPIMALTTVTWIAVGIHAKNVRAAQEGRPSFHQIHTDLVQKYGEDPSANYSGPKTKIPTLPTRPMNEEAEALQQILIRFNAEQKTK